MKKNQDKLRELERTMLDALRRVKDAQQEFQAASRAVDRAFENELKRFAALKDPKAQREWVDRTIPEELNDLYEKQAMYPQGAPPPEHMWEVLKEIIKLLGKLVRKAWLIQGMDPGELPIPRPGPGGGPEVQP